MKQVKYIRTVKNVYEEVHFKEIKSNCIGKVYWLLNGIYNDVNNERCGKLYLNPAEQLKIEMEKAKEFAKLSKIMV